MLKKGQAVDYRDRDYAIKKPPPPAPPVQQTRIDILTGIVRRHLVGRDLARQALQEIHNDKLYAAKYGTFENYCRDELQIGRAHAYRLLEAENVKATLEMSPKETEKINENAVRVIKAIPVAERSEVVREVAKSGPVTAKRIASEVASRKPPPRPTQPVIDVQPEPHQPTLKREKHCPTCRCGINQ